VPVKQGRESPPVPIQQERRRHERVPFMNTCAYEFSEPIGHESVAIHEGKALSMNISAGGMVLFMDQAPPVQKVFEVRVRDSEIVKTPTTLVEVCWTRAVPIENNEKRYLVGVKCLRGLPSER
jgi:c-di-GMP-binding flagellar brake protein YcgR